MGECAVILKFVLDIITAQLHDVTGFTISLTGGATATEVFTRSNPKLPELRRL